MGKTLLPLIGLLTAAAFCLAADGPFGPRPTLKQLSAMLSAHGADSADHKARVKTIRAIDAFFDSTDRAKQADVVQFYQDRVELGLKALEGPIPAGKVRVVKFYSSSVVVRSADGCFSIDLCEGPCGDTWRAPEESKDKFATFRMTDAQRDRFVKLIDVYFFTHRHHDHTSFVLMDRLAQAGKVIIGPLEGKKWFARSAGAFAEKIQTPPGDTVHKIGNIRWVHYWGRQYMEWIDGDHERPIKDSPKTVENNCYVVELSGLKFGHGGDNREEAHVEWIKTWNEKGWKPDMCFSLGIGKFARDVLKLWGPAHIPVHDYEFRHENFNRLTWWLGRKPEARLKRGPLLFWGEHHDLPAPKTENDHGDP